MHKHPIALQKKRQTIFNHPFYGMLVHRFLREQPHGANFGFRKIGDGYQRIAADIGFKWTCSVEAGTLQVDGAVMLNRSDNIEVSGSGTLSGCGRFGGYSKVWVKNGGTLAPGSAEMPNEPMVITNSSRAVSIPLQLDEGSALRFHIDRNRASQLLVSGAVTGTSRTVPVAIDGETPPGRTWMLMEAASFAPTFALVPGTSGKLSVKTTATTSQLWYTRAPEHTMVILL